MRIRKGDRVGYRTILDEPAFDLVGKVIAVYPDGIPSCRRPMVKIEGKSGVVLESHCTEVGSLCSSAE